MKRFFLFACIVTLGFLSFGQKPGLDMEGSERSKPEQQQKIIENARPTTRRTFEKERPLLPGISQSGFKSGPTAYGWVGFAGNSGVPEGPVLVNLSEGSLASIDAVNPNALWMNGSDCIDQTWYAVSSHDYNSSLFTVDPVSGDYSYIGQTGFSMTGLAYDPADQIMYASGEVVKEGKSYLYSVDVNSGAATRIGMIIEGGIGGIACDKYGNVYGINLSDNCLYSVNTKTGHGTLIGELGLTLGYAQDIGYDRDNDVLFGALYKMPEQMGGLYTIDTETGTAKLVNEFIAEVTALAVPYTLANDQAPDFVSSLDAETHPDGLLEAIVTWTNPSETFGGETLTELSQVIVERDGQIIYTIDNPVIGGDETFIDSSIPEIGIYNYFVYAINSAGEGPKKPFAVYIGPDTPAAPSNIVLSAVDDNGFLSWDEPAEGFNGGFFNGEGLSYTIVRHPDNIVVAESIFETEFLDNAIPGLGNYYYTVTAFNNMGQGGTAASNRTLLAGGEFLILEDFDLEINLPPLGWTLEGEPHDWAISQSSRAGGVAPELCLYYHSERDGLGRLISGPVSVEGNQNLCLSLKQYLINFQYIGDEVIGFDITYDDGQTWEVLWEKVIGSDHIHPDDYFFYFTTPENATQCKIGIRFDGYSFLINYWLIDDIVLKPAGADDLVVKSLSGSSIPIAGSESVYYVEVINAGYNTQNNYAVKLMNHNGVELATTMGESINFGQSIVYELAWNPSDENIGNDSIYAYVEFLQDENLDNNLSYDLQIIVQPSDILPVYVGEHLESKYDIPFAFRKEYSITQTLYYPEELGMSVNKIRSILYTNNFDEDVNNVHVQIWMGEIQNDNLGKGWVDPRSLQPVFDGLIDFPKGINEIFIPLDEPYLYKGGNLIVYSNKPGNQLCIGGMFHVTNTGLEVIRSLHLNEDVPFDPLNLPDVIPATEYVPDITFIFSNEMGSVQGFVTANGEPVEGVNVKISGSTANLLTDENGNFHLPNVLEGTYNIEFTKFGYYDVVLEDVVIETNQNTDVSVAMEFIPKVTLTGKIIGSDTGSGIADAAISLKGYQNYVVKTDSSGQFSIDDVFIDKEYSLTVKAQGYFVLEQFIDEFDDHIDLGEICLTELTYPVSGVLAEEKEDGALVSWNVPGVDVVKLFQHDGEVPYEPFMSAEWSKLYGTIFDVSEFHDAKLNSIDFHHLQYDFPGTGYEYYLYIVDWNNKEILTTIGPLSTSVINDWENGVPLDDFDVAGYERIGVFIHPLGNSDYNAFPNVTTDSSGPSGLSVVAFVDDLGNYKINPSEMGDFLINLWVTTGFGENGVAKAPNVNPFSQQSLKSRKGTFSSGTVSSFTQWSEILKAGSRALASYKVYRLAEGQESDMGTWDELQVSLSDTFYVDTQWHDVVQGMWKYAVIAEYTAGNLSGPAFSNSLQSDNTSVVESELPDISIFPNPAKDRINIRADEIILEIRMIDILGQLVYNQTVGDVGHEINVSDLKTGLYLLQVVTTKGINTSGIQVSR